MDAVAALAPRTRERIRPAGGQQENRDEGRGQRETAGGWGTLLMWDLWARGVNEDTMRTLNLETDRH